MPQMSGNLMLRVDPQVHANAAIAAELAGKSLNQWAEEILRRGSGQQKAVSQQVGGLRHYLPFTQVSTR